MLFLSFSVFSQTRNVLYYFSNLCEHENFSGLTQRFMLVRQRLGAILLLFPAEAEGLFLAHGKMFDVEALQQNCNGIFSILSSFFIISLSARQSLWEYSWKLQKYHWKCAHRSDVI